MDDPALVSVVDTTHRRRRPASIVHMVELGVSERVLWTGRPMRYPLFGPPDRLLFGWGLGLTGVLVMFLLAPLGWISVVPLAMAPVVLDLVVGRPVARRLALRDTRYTVTTLRVIVEARGYERGGYLAIRRSAFHSSGQNLSPVGR